MINLAEIKNHLKLHKEAYIAGGFGISVAIITYVIMRESRAVLQSDAGRPLGESTGSFLFGKSIFGSVTNNPVTTVHNGAKGHSGFVTRCVETGEIFATQGNAARAFDIHESFLSDHLNRGIDLKQGLHFERVGVFN